MVLGVFKRDMKFVIACLHNLASKIESKVFPRVISCFCAFFTYSLFFVFTHRFPEILLRIFQQTFVDADDIILLSFASCLISHERQGWGWWRRLRWCRWRGHGGGFGLRFFTSPPEIEIEKLGCFGILGRLDRGWWREILRPFCFRFL